MVVGGGARFDFSRDTGAPGGLTLGLVTGLRVLFEQ